MALAHDISDQKRTADIKVNETVDFTSLLLSENTLCGLQKSGFRKPSPIQQQAIPIGKCGFDLVIKSKSGTGKTAVFAVIALEMIDLSRNCIQCLIIAPTREIAVQIQGVIETIGSEYKGLKVHSFIGGMPIADDTTNLQCCHIAVGAPGRLKHLIEAGVLKTDSVKLLVLDEADKLMEPSFYDDINVIYYKLPKCFQMIAASATYPNNLDYYISQYMHTPTHINALNEETPLLLGLRQFIATVRQTANSMLEKTRLLIKLLSNVQFTQCIVFSNYQTRAESVSNVLNTEGFASVYISAAQAQPDRLAALATLKSFQCRVILSTDLTARGIDASNVDLVINYDVPSDVCTYLHRMGRAGRYGSHGLCVTLAENGRELQNFKKIIGFLGGTNMSISKLSNTDDWQSDDLWKGDLFKFDQISGILTPISNYDDVQKSLLELRQYKSNNPVQSQTNNIPTDCANSHKYSSEDIIKFRTDPNLQHHAGHKSKLCDILEPLIESSKLNEDNIIAILRRNCRDKGSNEIENSDIECIAEDCSSKRKRIVNDNSPSNGFMPQEKKNLGNCAEKPENVFQKNIGVLNVTRLLCDETTDVSADISGNIGQFLNQLKGISTTKSVITEETPENEHLKRFNELARTQITENTEKLFKFAFDYAVDEQNQHWLTQINENFDENEFDASREVLDVKENLLEDFHNVDFDAMECDDESEAAEDSKIEETDEVFPQNENAEGSNKRKSQIIDTTDYSRPANKATTSRRGDEDRQRKLKRYGFTTEPSDSQICDDNKYNRLFMERGGEFLDKYKKHEQFAVFKNYWRKWKDNIDSVRNVVQQKIYFEEMTLIDKMQKKLQTADTEDSDS